MMRELAPYNLALTFSNVDREFATRAPRLVEFGPQADGGVLWRGVAC